MKFNYVNITSCGCACKGWLNLFFGDHCVALINNVELANMIRKEIPEQRKTNQPLDSDGKKPPMEDNSLQPNCTQCKYHTFKKCLKGPNGEMLDSREVEQENGCDEYDCCSGFEPA